MKQIMIVRKDLHMSIAKFAVQCCHASMAFIKENIRAEIEDGSCYYNDYEDYDGNSYPRSIVEVSYDEAEWFEDTQTKIIWETKNKSKLLKCKEYASELGLKEGIDYFIIRDRCFTELIPEEIDEEGNKCTITAIGFRPLPNDIAEKISKHYQLYK